MNIGKLHHYWTKYRTATLVVPVAGLLICGGLYIYGMRANNVKMLELKQAVAVADEQNGDIEGALQDLRSFVNSHMNTQLRADESSEPPIQLVGQFNRYIEQERAKIAAQGNANKIYKDAQARCETGAIPLTARAQCIQEYVVANGGSSEELNLPPKELYTYDFVSARWSPDLAGVSLLGTIFFAVLLVIRLVAGFFIKRKI